MRGIFFLCLLMSIIQVSAQDALRTQLESSYDTWRTSLIQKNSRNWQQATAPHRVAEVRNRIISEGKPFPATVFSLPAPPPALGNLKFLEASVNGRTAKAAYFGKVDFGVGGSPTDNLLVLSFIRGATTWLYDRADYVNLTALPEVRKELARGDLQYLKGVPEAKPSGIVPPVPIQVNPATTLAKVYVFCPGREVQVQVNKVSRHRFANAKEAEIVIGGARPGSNEVQFTIRKLEGGLGTEALVIRVYLLSRVAGQKPIKAFEYLVNEGEPFEAIKTSRFILDTGTASRLSGR